MPARKPYRPVLTGVSFHPDVLDYLDRLKVEEDLDRSGSIRPRRVPVAQFLSHASGRTPGLWDYSGEPPSFRTSPSPGIRLYEPGTSRWVNRALSADASPGVPAHLEDAGETLSRRR